MSQCVSLRSHFSVSDQCTDDRLQYHLLENLSQTSPGASRRSVARLSAAHTAVRLDPSAWRVGGTVWGRNRCMRGPFCWVLSQKTGECMRFVPHVRSEDERCRPTSALLGPFRDGIKYGQPVFLRTPYAECSTSERFLHSSTTPRTRMRECVRDRT